MCAPRGLSDGLEAAAAEGGGGCGRGFEEVCSVEVGDWGPGVAALGSDAGAAAGKGSGGDEVQTARLPGKSK